MDAKKKLEIERRLQSLLRQSPPPPGKDSIGAPLEGADLPDFQTPAPDSGSESSRGDRSYVIRRRKGVQDRIIDLTPPG